MTAGKENEAELFSLAARGRVMGVFFTTGTQPSPDMTINCRQAIIELAGRAKVKIHVAIYMLTDVGITDALIAAHQRGLEVTVVCDQTEAVTATMKTQLDRLSGSGVTVKVTAKQHALMHNKVMIVDDRFVATGSYNWTARASRSNDENLVLLDGPDVAATYEKYVFQRILNFETLRAHNPAAAPAPDRDSAGDKLRQAAIALAPYYATGGEFNDDPVPANRVVVGFNPQPDAAKPAMDAGLPLDQYGNALPLYPPVNNPDAPSIHGKF